MASGLVGMQFGANFIVLKGFVKPEAVVGGHYIIIFGNNEQGGRGVGSYMQVV